MVARRHWLPLLTLAALLVGPFALVPQAAQGQTFAFTYTVDKLTDDSPPASGVYCTSAPNDCSLRQALTLARQQVDTAAKLINFASGLSGQMQVTNPSGVLPALDSRITIQGRVVLGVPQIAIVGASNNRHVGIQVAGNENTVSNLVIYGFDNPLISPGNGSAISISGDNNRIFNNYIGVQTNGTVPENTNIRGIQINAGADGNIIGYDQALGGLANVISGNDGIGVDVLDASRNVIRGNYIGLFPSGEGANLLGNGSYGIQISSNTGAAQENVIGGAGELEANIIGGNADAGLLIRGSDTLSTSVQSNFIGAYVASVNLGNSGDGIRIEAGARATALGGGVGAPLLVSDNDGHGIHIRNVGTRDTTVGGRTLVGLNFDETGAFANGLDGIHVADGVVGTQILGGGVRVGGNTGVGVRVANSDVTTIDGAYIGLAPSPSVANTTVPLANTGGGVLLSAGASEASIRGATISGNGQFGVRVSETMTVTLVGNVIGLNLARTGPLANAGPGVAVYSSTNTLIGGAANGSRNYIAGNAGPGVVISGTGTLSTTVDGNMIGLRRASAAGLYTAAAANGAEGVLVLDGPQQTRVGDQLGNIIGGAAAAATDPAGIRVLSSPPVGDSPPVTVTLTTIRNNTVGAIPNGTQPAVDRGVGDGIVVEGAGVGGVEILSNTVRLNSGDAVRVSAAMTVTVGAANLLANNAGRGVFVNAGATDIQVISNTISANTGAAVRLEDVATRRVSIRSNAMPGNGGLVQLAGTTLYDGTPPDPVGGPNHDIDPPFNIRVNQGGLIRGQVYTSTLLAEDALSPASACVSCTIQVFSYNPALPATSADRWRLLAFDEGSGEVIVPDASGNFSAQLADAVPAGQLLFAATDGYGNTSEFAVFVPSAGLRIVPLTPPSAAQSAAPGQTVTYTLRVENTGSLDLNNVRLTTSGTLARWVVSPNPAPAISLPGLGSQVVTYTLTLPTGSDPSVRVPITDVTTVTAQANLPQSLDRDGTITDTQRLTTTVLAAARLRVAPARGNGSGVPNQPVTYEHTLYNEGNITITVNLDASTLDAANSGRVWDTELSLETVTLGPGQEREVGLTVTVPSTAQQGARATHFITATVVGAPDQTRYFSDTTTVDFDQRAELFSDETQDGLPGGTVIFRHTVRNTSNGPATFRLDYQANLGSTVRFFSETPGITINNDGTFTINNISEPANTMILRAEVSVNELLFVGDTEVINIFLRDPATGDSIGGAVVVDRIDIRGSLVRPRLWLPMIFNGAAPR